ncbi:caspase-8-like isoform X1 [Poecilia reticulata]|uniref:Caspase 20, apoptosis-related cysteine peptidase n=1 Tax=Poecilia reticulata TaxID=8081 RepID=A0A3P9MYY1_POERE|nr:PREDICTED: caspase-8-like isoform X1 [Poecilia reticulata]
MSATETLKCNKVKLIEVLCGDHKFILNKVQEKKLITSREYNNLKSINKEHVEGHVVELVDKIMDKGEKTCQNFLELLQTDDVAETYPDLEQIKLHDVLPKPVPATSPCSADMVPGSKRLKKDEVYELKSQPVGLCLIINNENFHSLKQRRGTNKDAESLAHVFSWLGFKVLMCKDQTGDQMEQTLKLFASPHDEEKQLQLQELDVQEWCGGWLSAPQQPVRHGDAFVCCILSHGSLGNVHGVDSQPLAIKEIKGHFVATKQPALTGKPKVFLIQACQHEKDVQRGVLQKDVEEDSTTSIPEEADFLVAVSTVEDYVSFRHPIDGSWFIQSVCEQLKLHCPSGEDITSILLRVNNMVGQKEGSFCVGQKKQAPEVKFTLRKKLILSPRCT